MKQTPWFTSNLTGWDIITSGNNGQVIRHENMFHVNVEYGSLGGGRDNNIEKLIISMTSANKR
jgi:hypothetical protein